MTTDSWPYAAGGVNPYSPTPVARVAEGNAGTITEPTDAVRDATSILDAYFRPHEPADVPRRGGVLTVVGEYGTGKTHLAVALLQRARESGRAHYGVYLDAPAGTFVDLYQRFVGQLDRLDVVELLRDYYADIVADELAEIPQTDPIANRLRAGEIDPVEVVRDLQLRDSVLLQRMQHELTGITGDDDFGTALTLLLEPALGTTIWDWLAGNPPNEFLRDRGVVRTIDRDDPALAGLLAFVLLYSRRGYRFVLVIDEFDRVLAAIGDQADGEDRIGAFQRVLEKIEQSGAFVMLAGLTDIVQALGESVLQRMGRIIHMPPMTPPQVRAFIRKSHRSARGDDELEPFTDVAVDYLVGLTNGVPRQIIKLCHHLYRRAQDTGAPVTPELVQQVAREYFDLASVPDVRREVYRVLHREGIRFSRGHLRDTDGEPVVDFWVTGPGGEFRCALLISGSVLTTADVVAVNRRIVRAQAEADDVQTVLVVVGYLAREVTADLDGLLDALPIEFVRHSFSADLSAVVTDILRRFNESSAADPLTTIRDRVDRITRQQASTQGLVELVAQHVTGLGEATERQLTAIRRELAGAARGARPTSGTPGDRDRAPIDDVLAGAEQLFTRALATLARIDRMEHILAPAFSPAPERAGTVFSARLAVQARLQQQDGFAPLGTAVFLRQLIETFHAAFLDWYHASDAWSVGQLSSTDRSRLDALCISYEAIYQYIPLQQLKKLAEVTTPYPDQDDGVQGLAWQTVRLDEMGRTFGELGGQVRQAVRAWGGEADPFAAR